MIMAYFNDPIMSGSAVPHANFDNCLGIYYQKVRGFGAKKLVFYDDVCSSDFTLFVCPRHGSTTCHLIAVYFLVDTSFFRSDGLYTNKAHGGGVLSAIPTFCAPAGADTI
jgi:hypothetical protein